MYTQKGFIVVLFYQQTASATVIKQMPNKNLFYTHNVGQIVRALINKGKR